MRRPRSGHFLSLFFEFTDSTVIVVACAGWESGKPVFGFSTFPGGARRGGGNVKISPVLRDFQGAVESMENLWLVFHALHRPVISTAPLLPYRKGGGTGDCTLHRRSSRDLAAPILRAYSVSLIASASRSNSAKLTPGLRYCSTFSSDFSFSNGVR